MIFFKVIQQFVPFGKGNPLPFLLVWVSARRPDDGARRPPENAAKAERLHLGCYRLRDGE